MINFSQRCGIEEQMDDPQLDARMLQRVFRDLNRTNTLLGGQRITLKALESIMNECQKDSYTLVDMGCGDGDLLRKLALQCRRRGVRASFIGVDQSRAALDFAQEQSSGFPEITFHQANLLEAEGEELRCDILLCTLTLHHFSDAHIPLLLKNFVRLASLGVVINDLQRNRLAYYLFIAFSRIFIKTKIAKQDGLISIRSGFHRETLLRFSKALPGYSHRIHWRWVFRYLWVIRSASIPSHE